jgi:hypothetical protein
LAVNALYVRDIARRYQGRGRRVVGRRRIHSGCVLTRRYLEYWCKRWSREIAGARRKSGEDRGVGESDTVVSAVRTQRVREDGHVAESILCRHLLTTWCKVDRLIEDYILTDTYLAIRTISVYLDVLVHLGKEGGVGVNNEVRFQSTRCVDLTMSVVEGYVDPAATPEGVKLTDVDVPPRNHVMGGVFVAGMIVEGMGVTCIGHSETSVQSRDRRIGVEHDCNDSDGAFGDAVSVLIARCCGLNAIAVGWGGLKEGVGAVVVLGVESDEAVSVFLTVLQGWMESKKNRELGYKLLGGSIFSKDRADASIGRIGE